MSPCPCFAVGRFILFHFVRPQEDDKAKLRSSSGAAASAGGAAKPKGSQSPLVTLIKTVLPFVIIALAYYYNKQKSAAA